MPDDSSLDAPRPPGGPQRADAPDGSSTPGEPARDPGPGATRPTRPEGENDPPEVSRRESQDDEERDLQEENAETSRDQPST